MTFYFYDTETSGTNPRSARVMQFAGVRTNMKLEPIGEPHNILLRLSDDVLPEPDAVLVHGITPQKANQEGYTEAEFLNIFHDEIATEGTIFVGFNSVRFDDEFVRYLNWRNFYDPYEWQWKAGRSRWDLLDLTRMTRALRPDGIEWPFGPDGRESNRLELLSSVNNLSHEKAHDALSDVWACVDLARLIYQKQPKLFEYLLTMRDKKEVAKLVDNDQPFVYTSGKYSSEYKKTTVVIKIGDNPTKAGGALVYDLRVNPEEFLHLSPVELADRLAYTRDESAPKRLPIKTIAYNKCPAVAPIGVLDEEAKLRLKIDNDNIKNNLKILQLHKAEFFSKVVEAIHILDKSRQTTLTLEDKSVDAELYSGFVGDQDRAIMIQMREDIAHIDDYIEKYKDSRLKELLPLYKARNYPQKLSSEEREAWEMHRFSRLMDGGDKSRAANFFKRLTELSKQENLTQNQKYLIEELNLYGQSILPIS